MDDSVRMKSSSSDKLIISDDDPLANSCINPSYQKWKRKLMIIGDNYARGCITRVETI
jgi:hypothetical protein